MARLTPTEIDQIARDKDSPESSGAIRPILVRRSSVLPDLLEAANEESRPVSERAALVEAVGSLGSDPADAVAGLMAIGYGPPLGADHPPELRRAVHAAISRIGKDALPGLRQVVDTGSPIQVRLALQLTRGIGGRSAVRRAVPVAYRRMGRDAKAGRGEAVVVVFRHVLEVEGSRTKAQEAPTAPRVSGLDTARDAMLRAARSPDRTVAFRAVGGLRAFGVGAEVAVPLLVEVAARYAASERPLVTDFINLYGLARYYESRGGGPVLADLATSSPSSAIRAAAVGFLFVEIGDPRDFAYPLFDGSVPTLAVVVAGDENAEVRALAATILGYLADDARAALPELRAALNGDPSPEVRAAAANALQAFD